jgi:electron transport complex protein RnfC
LPDARDDVPVVKATNCILAAQPGPVPAAAAGDALHPLRRLRQGLPRRTAAFRAVLVLARQDFRQGAGIPALRLHRMRLLRLRLPLAHPLVDYYRFAKSEIWAREARKGSGRSARERYEFRLLREEREKQEARRRQARGQEAAGREKAAAAAGGRPKSRARTLEEEAKRP